MSRVYLPLLWISHRCLWALVEVHIFFVLMGVWAFSLPCPEGPRSITRRTLGFSIGYMLIVTMSILLIVVITVMTMMGQVLNILGPSARWVPEAVCGTQPLPAAAESSTGKSRRSPPTSSRSGSTPLGPRLGHGQKSS